MKGTPTGTERHPKLAKKLVFDDEYMMTEKEIAAVFERWRKEVAEHPEEFGSPEKGSPTDARQFLNTLSAIRCEAVGLL